MHELRGASPYFGRHLRPWYYEAGQRRLFNSWSLAHLAWGVAAYWVFQQYWPGITLHMAYELLEDVISPRPPGGRDPSFINHLGDTIAFIAGQLLAAWLLRLEPPLVHRGGGW